MKILKAIIYSVLTLAGGFAAIAVPFNLISTFKSEGLHIVFMTELAIYFTLGIIFLIAKEKKEIRAKKEKARRLERREKCIKAQEEYYNIAA